LDRSPSSGLARSTVQRIVAALQAEHFLARRSPARRAHRPGLARIAASLGTNAVELLRPHLTALSEQVGETVDLSCSRRFGGVRRSDPGKTAPHRALAVGERFPLHCTANGKAILACFSTEDAAAMIEKSLAHIQARADRQGEAAEGDRNSAPQASCL